MAFCDNKNAVVKFRDEYYFLSNFYPAKLTYEGITYLSSEAAYQAQKYGDYEKRAEFSELTAEEAKNLGSIIEVRCDWNDIKLDVMKKVVFAKFSQNPDLAKLLIETGDMPLYEGNTWGDLFWGVDLETGEGENNLGKILIELRKDFAENGLPKQTRIVKPMILKGIGGVGKREYRFYSVLKMKKKDES